MHGFRSAFRDWAAEQTSYPGEVAEAALAHTVANKVEAAYLRTNYLDKRREMMADWATFCTQPASKALNQRSLWEENVGRGQARSTQSIPKPSKSRLTAKSLEIIALNQKYNRTAHCRSNRDLPTN